VSSPDARPVPAAPPTQTIDLDIPVHYREWSSTGGDATIVLVPGLGGSSLNWMLAAPLLTRRGRVLAPDLAGQGHTTRGARASSLEANRELLDDFIAAMTDGPVVLVGNSMGGALSMLEAAASPERVEALVLVDAALPSFGQTDPMVAQTFAAYATPGVGEELIRQFEEAFGPEGMVRTVMDMVSFDSSRIPDEVIQAHIDQLRAHMGEERGDAFLESARTLVELLTDPDRLREAWEGVRAPTLIITGDSDRLVPLVAPQALAELRPDWTFEILDHVGHAPQLEVPERFVQVTGDWLDTLGVAPAAA
jgi:pimeloyl-ACP methyl ester carboxylesterase